MAKSAVSAPKDIVVEASLTLPRTEVHLGLPADCPPLVPLEEACPVHPSFVAYPGLVGALPHLDSLSVFQLQVELISGKVLASICPSSSCALASFL